MSAKKKVFGFLGLPLFFFFILVRFMSYAIYISFLSMFFLTGKTHAITIDLETLEVKTEDKEKKKKEKEKKEEGGKKERREDKEKRKEKGMKEEEKGMGKEDMEMRKKEGGVMMEMMRKKRGERKKGRAVSEKQIKRFDIRVIRLKNGLPILLIPKRDGSGVSAFFVWVRSGASDEPPEFFGGAHILEHIVFKGSPELGVGEVANAIESVGGYINAWTSYDNTVYWSIIPSEHLTAPAKVLSEIVWFPEFTEKEFETEKGVVLEEWRRGKDIPSYRLYHEFFERIYKNHPYGHPVIGYEDTIKKITPELVLKFHKKFYSPDNVFVVVAGDFDEKKIIPSIKKLFGRVKKMEGASLRKKNVRKFPDFRGPDYFYISGKEKEAIFMMGFLGLPYSLTASAYLDLIAEVLDTRLYEKLRLKDVIANSVDVGYWSPAGVGIFEVYATAKAENLGKILDVVSEEIRKLKMLGVSEKELQAAKNSLLSDIFESFQSVRGLASTFGYAFQYAENPHAVYDYVEIIRTARKQDIEKLFSVLDEKRMLLGIYVNDEDRRYAEDLSSQVAKLSFAVPTKLPLRLVRKSHGIEKYESENGVRVLLKKMPGTGTITITAMMPGGQIFYGKEKVGIPLFTARMLTRGTESRTAKIILDEITEIGGGIGASAGFDSFSLSSSFLSDRYEKGFDIFFDVLLHPTFPEEEMEKIRKDILEDLRTRWDVPSTQAFDELYKLVFEGTPYAFPEKAKKEVVEKAGRQELIDFWKFILSDPEKIVIAVVGDFSDSKEILRTLLLYGEELFSKKKEREIQLPDRVPCSDNFERKVKREGNQVHIIVGFCGPSLRDEEDSIALRVLTASISGMGGRLFMNLREKKGLAYVVSPIRYSFLAGGIFGGYIASAPGKLSESLSGLKEELMKLAEISDKEIKRGKNVVLGSVKRGLQSNSSWASQIASDEFLGFGFDRFSKIRKLIREVTRERIKEVLEKYVENSNPYVVILGVEGGGESK